MKSSTILAGACLLALVFTVIECTMTLDIIKRQGLSCGNPNDTNTELGRCEQTVDDNDIDTLCGNCLEVFEDYNECAGIDDSGLDELKEACAVVAQCGNPNNTNTELGRCMQAFEDKDLDTVCGNCLEVYEDYLECAGIEDEYGSELDKQKEECCGNPNDTNTELGRCVQAFEDEDLDTVCDNCLEVYEDYLECAGIEDIYGSELDKQKEECCGNPNDTNTILGRCVQAFEDKDLDTVCDNCLEVYEDYLECAGIEDEYGSELDKQKEECCGNPNDTNTELGRCVQAFEDKDLDTVCDNCLEVYEDYLECAGIEDIYGSELDKQKEECCGNPNDTNTILGRCVQAFEDKDLDTVCGNCLEVYEDYLECAGIEDEYGSELDKQKEECCGNPNDTNTELGRCVQAFEDKDLDTVCDNCLEVYEDYLECAGIEDIYGSELDKQKQECCGNPNDTNTILGRCVQAFEDKDLDTVCGNCLEAYEDYLECAGIEDDYGSELDKQKEECCGNPNDTNAELGRCVQAFEDKDLDTVCGNCLEVYEEYLECAGIEDKYGSELNRQKDECDGAAGVGVALLSTTLAVVVALAATLN